MNVVFLYTHVNNQAGETLEFQNKVEVCDKLSDNAAKTFEELKIRRKHRYLILKMGNEEIEGNIV